MSTETVTRANHSRVIWNKGRLVGQKRPLRPKEVWAIRVRLQMKRSKRDLAMFNLAIDSKLRGCDLVALRVDDVTAGGSVRDRATVIQHKTGRPVQFEITEQTRASLQEWLNVRPTDRGPSVFPSRVRAQPHVTARQYARIVRGWIEAAGMVCSCLSARMDWAAAVPAHCNGRGSARERTGFPFERERVYGGPLSALGVGGDPAPNDPGLASVTGLDLASLVATQRVEQCRSSLLIRSLCC
jgi:integrase